MKSNTITQVLALCDEFDATPVDSLPAQPADTPVLDVVVTMSDKRRVSYRLVLNATSDVVHAREASPDKLPSFCPQLHINRDASFCMGWSKTNDLNIIDEASARKWWSHLHAYLRLQHRAMQRRKWPDKEWAHGDAALHQYNAEQQASLLGENFIHDLDKQKIQVRAYNRLLSMHGRLLRVYRDNDLIYTVSEKFSRVLNMRQKCVCIKGDIKRHRRLRSCHDHAKAAADFALSLWKWDQAEEQVWAAIKTEKCCGRMDGCRLQL
jgi:hypothetical protein